MRKMVQMIFGGILALIIGLYAARGHLTPGGAFLGSMVIAGGIIRPFITPRCSKGGISADRGKTDAEGRDPGAAHLQPHGNRHARSGRRALPRLGSQNQARPQPTYRSISGRSREPWARQAQYRSWTLSS